MKKICVSLIFLAALFLIGASGAILAQGEPAAAIISEETITTEDLGVSNPGILPTSPFYFFKEMGRGIKSLVTFNPVAKAELELKIANEKAAEVKKIAETQPQNTQAIQKALENYQNTQEKLRQRFEKISETSQNPRVDTLLNNLTDKVVKHEKLFDEISFKFKEKEGISKAIINTMAGSENVIGEASKKDDAAKFSSRLEKVLLEEKGGDLKHVRSVEIIDRFSGKTTTAVKESLERLREEFSERLESDIENLVKKEGGDVFNEKLSGTPGNSGKRSVIIEEIQKRAEDRLSETLGKAMEYLETAIQKETDIAQKTKEQIKRAGEMILEAEKKIQGSESGKTSAVVSSLLDEAGEHLKNARSAFEEKKYGEAFGQARSAEVLARNAIKFYEKEKPETENFEQQLKETDEKISIYKKLLDERNFNREQNKEAFELLDNAVLHLGYAKEAFANENLANTKLHIGHVRDFLSKLSRFLEIRKTSVAPEPKQIQPDTKPTILPAKPSASRCEEITKNIAKLKELLASKRIAESDFKIKYNEHLRKLIICQEAKNALTPLPSAVISPTLPRPVTETSCTTEYDPVCDSNGNIYSNVCLAKTAGVSVISRECKAKTEKPESIAPPAKTIESINSTANKLAE